MKISFKKKTKQKDQKTVKKSFQWWESNTGPSTCKVDPLSIAPRQPMLNIQVELIIYITIDHDISPVDGV